MKWYKTVTYEIEAGSRYAADGLWEVGGPEIPAGYPIRQFAETSIERDPVPIAFGEDGHGKVH